MSSKDLRKCYTLATCLTYRRNVQINVIIQQMLIDVGHIQMSLLLGIKCNRAGS